MKPQRRAVPSAAAHLILVRPVRRPHPLARIAKHSFVALFTVMGAVVLLAGAFRLQSWDARGHAMLDAFRSGRSAEGRLLIWLGADPNYATGSGSAMHLAASAGDIDLMRFLIAHGADPDRAVKWRITPLHKAREYHQIEAARFLIAHGADPETTPQARP
jgi:Ankyrin repeats (3 copies)